MEPLRAQQAALADELATVQRELSDLRATGHSPDGLVTATVDGRGIAVDLNLDPRIYRSTDSGALAEKILAALREATDQAAAEAFELSRRVLRDGGRVRLDSDPSFDPVRDLLAGRR